MFTTLFCKMAKLAVLLVVFFAGLALAVTPPKFSETYNIRGVLNLPYAELEEPFEAWLDTPNSRARIDYYDGMDKTYWLGKEKDYGNIYKISPMTTESKKNVKTCFLLPGTKDAPVKPQSMLPDISSYKFASSEVLDGKAVNIWRSEQVQGTRNNTYTMYVSKSTHSPIPIRYVMMGYDTLIGSHYDKYVVDYYEYSTKTPDDEIFNVTAAGASKCGGFPGPGLTETETSIAVNPFHEVFGSCQEDRFDQFFDEFKQQHQRELQQPKEYAQRNSFFRGNVRYIHSKNRAGLTFKLAVNHLADQSREERHSRRGRLYTKGGHPGLPFDSSSFTASIPDHIDWSRMGAVTQVKDQATCGSCWSFGTTGCIEGAYFVKTKQKIRLSQANLMDCTWGEGNNGCDGGEEWRSYEWIKKHGLASEKTYGHGYLGQNGDCKYEDSMSVIKLKSYHNITSGNQTELKMALANVGPVAVGIDAAHDSFAFYSSGVYYEEKCGNKPENLDHAVLAVGYDKMIDQEYWIVKNSWSTYWGDNGYVLMSLKDNNCGVATDATYVVLE